MQVRRVFLVAFVVLLAAAGIFLVVKMGNGGENSNAGSSRIRINEVMSSNKGAVADEQGDFPDWVELYNPTPNSIDISGFGLSDSLLDGVKWAFPRGTIIPANGYVVVFCSGDTTKGSLHASFKLSAGEELILYNATGSAIDNLKLTSVATNATLGIDATGQMAELSHPSPGYANTEEGVLAYRESVKTTAVDNGIRINEFMASNATTLAGPHNEYPDWIELYNTTGEDVDISGCGLSDSLDSPMKWMFPAGTIIKAHDVLLVYCSGRDGLVDDTLHAPFGLRTYAEDVVFSGANGAVIDGFSYTSQETDISMARIPDGTGEFQKTSQPTPGFLNTDEGFAAFSKLHSFPKSGLMISEVLSNNAGSYEVNSDTPDWIELHNSTAQSINLSGYALTDNPKNPTKWVFPDMTIDPGQYLLVLATGNDVRDTQKKNLETNFGLSSDGEVLLLYSPEAELLDRLAVKNAGADVSIGRLNDQTLYFDKPTPGAANAGGYPGVTAIPEFSVTPGIYDGAVELTITAEAGASIYYTTDCNKPTANSTLYTGPISITENTVVRAVAVRNEYMTGPVLTGTYLLKSDQVNHALPVATLVFEPDALWDSKTGIYAFGEKYDPDLSNPDIGDSMLTANWYQGRGYQGEEVQTAWERDATFSVFDENGQEVFKQDVSSRLAGAYGRSRAQKGFTVIARSKHGKSRMEYPFFEDRPFTEYKSLVLRAGAQDQNSSKIRDELSTAILEGVDVNFLYQAYTPYVLYLNGEYWGVYFLKEKRSRFFVAAHEGVEDVDNLDLLKASTQVSYGSNKEWLELDKYIKNNDLKNQSNFDHVASIIDADSFMDYMICEIYTGNTDTANIQYYKLPGGKFKWVYYDFCWGFGSGRANHNTLSYRRGAKPAGSDLFNALLKNDAWRDKFIRRFAELLNTAFVPERIQPMIDELYATVEPEIARERAKFNGDTFMGVTQRAEVKGTYEGFVKSVERVREFVNARPAELKKQIQQEFSLSESYMQEVFG
ncbi:lamin tail domain-containing protein [Christensenellaceae bacterium OttesenSCG-928-M15]|nr:lamin tail domain-containing protein [Christensenellaceae bacterium OttesenSCG-928-M15]